MAGERIDQEAFREAFAAQVAQRALDDINRRTHPDLVREGILALPDSRRLPQGLNRQDMQEIVKDFGENVPSLFANDTYYLEDIRQELGDFYQDKLEASRRIDDGEALRYLQGGGRVPDYGRQPSDRFNNRLRDPRLREDFYRDPSECLPSSVPDPFCEKEFDRRERRERRTPESEGGYQAPTYIPGRGLVYPEKRGALPDEALPRLAASGVGGGEEVTDASVPAVPRDSGPRQLS